MLNSIQISHACAILLSTLLFPLSLIIIEFILNGRISESGFGYAIVMFAVGPVYFFIGPMIGIVVHLLGMNVVFKKLACYSVAGIILGLIFSFFFNNGVSIGRFTLIGLLMTIIYFSIQHTAEKMLRKFQLS